MIVRVLTVLYADISVTLNRTRPLAMALVVVLVLSAGCSTLGGGGTSTPDSLGQAEFDQHDDALTDAGSATIALNITAPSDGDSVEVNTLLKADFDSNTVRSNVTIPLLGGVNIAQYYDGETTYEKTESSLTGTQYNATTGDQTYLDVVMVNTTDSETAPANGSVDVSDQSANLTFERLSTDGLNGATVYRANRTELIDTYDADMQGTVENATLEVHRTNNGVLNYMHLRLVTTVDGQRQLTELKYRITDLGSTDVTKPDWVSTAKMATGNSSA